MLLPLIFTAILALAAWSALTTGPCVALGRIIARAFVRLIQGKQK